MGAKESLAEFRKDSSMERDQMGQIQELVTAQWKSLPEDVYRVNWDVEIDMINKHIEVGIIVAPKKIRHMKQC